MAITRQEAVERLTVMMTKHVDQFFNELSEQYENPAAEAYEAMGLIGPNLNRLMAKSAMSTWEASMDAQLFLKDQGYADGFEF